MHIVLVVPGGVDRGGQDRVIPAVLWLIEGLAVAHRVTVVALGQEPVASRYSLLGASVVNVAPEERGPHRLARMVYRAVKAAGEGGRPDVVHGLWASVSGLAAVAAARRYRVPSLIHVAGGELVNRPDLGYGGAQGRGGRLISSGVLGQATRVTVASHWMADHVRAAGHRVDDVVPLGVDTGLFHPGRQPSPADRLIQIADLNRVKDHHTMLDALAIVRAERPTVTLDLLGTDTLGGSIHQRAADLGLGDAVRYHGPLRSPGVADALRGAGLHVLSSRHDAGPVAVLEAAACGLATVGTAVGHVADLAAASPPGAFAVSPGDPQALAQGILAVIGDEGRRASLASVARAFALSHDRWATVAAFEALYDKALYDRALYDRALRAKSSRASAPL